MTLTNEIMDTLCAEAAEMISAWNKRKRKEIKTRELVEHMVTVEILLEKGLEFFPEEIVDSIHRDKRLKIEEEPVCIDLLRGLKDW